MKIKFSKYHGTGNDFILIDNRTNVLNASNFGKSQIQKLCDRHFGIGSDGLMTLENHESLDFQMNYYNSDGSGSTMCGNGGRAIVAFAHHLGIFETNCEFFAVDSVYNAEISEDEIVKLKMKDISVFENNADYCFMNTGSPHVVKFLDNVDTLDVYSEGKKIRNSDNFSPDGTNVNFVENHDNSLTVRTYERGVEDETLSCGTGVVASALSAAIRLGTKSPIQIKTLGGELKVHFSFSDNKFTDIYLEGSAKFVFAGEIEI